MSNEIKVVKEDQKLEFNQLALHPLQSWEWGEFRKSQGHKVIRIGVSEGKNFKDVFQVSFHPIPLISLPAVALAKVGPTPLTVGYLPKSPFPDKEVLEKLKQVGRENKAIFIKIEPNIENPLSPNPCHLSPSLVKGKPLFTKYTSIIDLTRTEEEIFNSFKPKTRYNIRLAEKHGIKIQEENSNEAFKEYLNLLFETTKRQGFYAHNKEFHRQQWRVLQPAGISHLLTATYQGKILSAFLLFVFNGVLYYPYGASTREHKELMAPTLLMWEAIKFGKTHDCTKFDLWGDIEPNPPPNHPYYGFHRFKEGFSPKLVEFAGTFDLVINPILYKIYQAMDFFRWKFLRLGVKL